MLTACSVEGCGRPAKYRSWCSAHYERWRSRGDVFAEVPIGATGVFRRGPVAASKPSCVVCGGPCLRGARGLRPRCSYACRLVDGESVGVVDRAKSRSKAASASQRKKRDTIQAFKTAQGCADCGYSANPVALDFDHREGETKSFPIASKISSFRLDRLWAEIAKCDVVCANCHRIRTHDRQQHCPAVVAASVLPLDAARLVTTL